MCLQHAAVSWRSSQPSLLAFTHEVSPYTLQDRCEMCLFACRICILSGVLSCHIRTLPLNKIVFLAARCAFSLRLPRFRSQSTAYTSTHRALSCEEHLFSRDMQIFTQRVTISHQPVLYGLKIDLHSLHPSARPCKAPACTAADKGVQLQTAICHCDKPGHLHLSLRHLHCLVKNNFAAYLQKQQPPARINIWERKVR